ncbi:MAG: hypothetical protein JXR83_13610 [Deltaproteobacteria bacterium]|nr:hypothetical protein [Deltaproteobacteria bacterium]
MRLSHLLAALVIAGVVFAVGHLASGALAPNDWRKDLLSMPPRPAAPASEPAPGSEPAVATGQPEQPASGPAVAIAIPTLQSTKGTVERKGRVGRWQSVGVGDHLDPGSSLRTATDSQAMLAWSIASISLGASTTMQFDKDLNKIWLESGELGLNQRAEGEAIEIANRDGRVRVRGIRGEYTVQVKPGLVVVKAREAEAELISAGKTVALGANTIGWAVPGKPPVEPFATDHKPELKVNEPRLAQVSTPTIVIKGQTEPLTEVTVNGEAAKVDAQGAFSAVVPLSEGENAIAVVARLFTGTESRQELNPITRVKKAAAPVRKKPAIKWGPGQ